MAIAEIREIIIRLHPLIGAILETGLGLSHIFTESQIMVATLLDLNRQGITNDELKNERSHLTAPNISLDAHGKFNTKQFH
jgi:hypothetical protein